MYSKWTTPYGDFSLLTDSLKCFKDVEEAIREGVMIRAGVRCGG